MNAGEGADDQVEALRTDIETTSVELAETVNELSNRLDAKKRVGAVTEGVAEGTKQVVGHAQELTKESATKAQDLAMVWISRSRQLADGRRQLIGAAALIAGLFLMGHLLKHRR
jgi:hypothetical protein